MPNDKISEPIAPVQTANEVIMKKFFCLAIPIVVEAESKEAAISVAFDQLNSKGFVTDDTCTIDEHEVEDVTEEFGGQQ